MKTKIALLLTGVTLTTLGFGALLRNFHLDLGASSRRTGIALFILGGLLLLSLCKREFFGDRRRSVHAPTMAPPNAPES